MEIPRNPMTDPIESLEDALELLREALAGWSAADEYACDHIDGGCGNELCDQQRINEIRQITGL
jgi:hypothetical protein